MKPLRVATVFGTLIGGLLSTWSSAQAEVAPVGWMAYDTIRPVTGVPTDGFVSLGIAYQGFDCVESERLAALSVLVTLDGQAVAGALQELGELDGQVVWRPSAPLEAQRRYDVVVAHDPSAGSCTTGTLGVVTEGSFETGSGPASGPVAAITVAGFRYGGQACGAGTVGFNLSSEDEPYVGHAVSGDEAATFSVVRTFRDWTVSGPNPAQPVCVTLTSTHLLTDETLEQQLCTDDPNIVEQECLVESGCSSSGPAWPTAALAACMLLVLTTRRRRAAMSMSRL